MNHRTRQLLRLLSDPRVGIALKACAEDLQTNKDLEDLTGAKPTWMRGTLELLEAFGLVEAGPDQPRNGRPAATWRATSTKELATFERQANDFAKALARAIGGMVDDPAPPARLRVVDDAKR